MRILITGITGLIGPHLARYLLERRDFQVFGFHRVRSTLTSLEDLLDEIVLIQGDITDSHSVERAVDTARPDIIFHLAAQSFPRESWFAPTATLRTNIEGTVNILAAAHTYSGKTKVHIPGSAAEYGLVAPEDTPIREDRPLAPINPYGVSKVAAEQYGVQFAQAYSQPVYVTRSFNHIGTGQDPGCSVQNFCRQVADIESGVKPRILRVGNLEARRDFLDVRDAVRAFVAVVERGKAGKVYNVCSGVPRRVGDIAKFLTERVQAEITIEIDPTRLRPSDEPLLYGDDTAIRTDTGWKPEIAFADTLTWMLNEWRTKYSLQG